MRPQLLIRWVYGVTLMASLGLASRVMADPPVVHQSATQNVAGVVGENTAGGDGVFGIGGTTGRGVVGTSDNHAGVEGNTTGSDGVGVFGSGKAGRGVVGVSEQRTAVEGNSAQGIGVWGSTNSASAAGGEFHNNQGGDLIRAGKDTVFRVSNNGDVFVRGQRIGATGPQGPLGPQGPPGPPGVRTVAVCAEATGLGNPTCPCQNRTVTRQAGPCTVTSDTGSCSAAQNGCCAVCAP
jgi:hypothetical protein